MPLKDLLQARWPRRRLPAGVRGRRGSALVGVVTVINEEFDEVKEMLATTVHIEGTGYYVRRVQADHNYDVVLKQVDGRGNVKANEATAAIIESFRPAYLLLIGIAGGVAGRDGTNVGDVIVSDFVDYYELRKLNEGRSLRRCLPYDQPGLRCVTLRVARDACRKMARSHQRGRRPTQDDTNPVVRVGPLISGEKILGDDEAKIQQDVLAEFDNALAVDMSDAKIVRLVCFRRRVSIDGYGDVSRQDDPETRGPDTEPQIVLEFFHSFCRTFV